MTKLKEIKKQKEAKEKNKKFGENSLIGKITEKLIKNQIDKIVQNSKSNLLLIILGTVFLFLVYSTIHISGIKNSANLVKIDYYYSNICVVCDKQAEVIDEVKHLFGEKINLEKKCVTLISEDSSKCVLEQGEEKYKKNLQEAYSLKTAGIPITKIGEKVFVGKASKEELSEEVCNQLYGVWGFIDLLNNKIEVCK